MLYDNVYTPNILVHTQTYMHVLGFLSGQGVINPRRACAARVTEVVLCVCLCVQAAHLRLTKLSDKLDILTDLVSCWLQNEFGVFRIMASFRR